MLYTKAMTCAKLKKKYRYLEEMKISIIITFLAIVIVVRRN